MSRLVLALTLAAFVSGSHAIKLAFSARNLPSMDPFNGAPDAYLNIYYAETASAPYTKLFKTDYILDSRNPDWPQVYDIPDNGGSTQMLKFDMYDADSPDSDDSMGHVEIRLTEILYKNDGILNKDLVGGEPGGGFLIIKRQR